MTVRCIIIGSRCLFFCPVLGENHPDVATIYNNIGSAYKAQGNYVQAMDCYQKSLSVRLAVYGENHPYVALGYNNIGCLYYNQGIYTQALENLNKSLDIYSVIFPKEHPGQESSGRKHSADKAKVIRDPYRRVAGRINAPESPY